MTVATRSSSECPASERIASDPVVIPTSALAAVRPADAAIEVRATLSLTSCIAVWPLFDPSRTRRRRADRHLARHAVEPLIEDLPAVPLQFSSEFGDFLAQGRCRNIRFAELDGVADQPGLHARRIGFDVKLHWERVGSFSERLNGAGGGSGKV